jgi:hypothetical protein
MQDGKTVGPFSDNFGIRQRRCPESFNLPSLGHVLATSVESSISVNQSKMLETLRSRSSARNAPHRLFDPVSILRILGTSRRNCGPRFIDGFYFKSGNQPGSLISLMREMQLAQDKHRSRCTGQTHVFPDDLAWRRYFWLSLIQSTNVVHKKNAPVGRTFALEEPHTVQCLVSLQPVRLCAAHD